MILILLGSKNLNFFYLECRDPLELMNLLYVDLIIFYLASGEVN